MEPVPLNQTALVQRIGLPLQQGKGWLKFVGVLTIVSGVLLVLATLGIGLVIAWLPIWMGVLLYQSAELADRAYASGDEATLVASLSKLRLYFVITGVVAVVSLALTMIMMSLGMLAGIAGLASMH